MTRNEQNDKVTEAPRIVLPVLPLRDVVVYPQMVVPLFVGREKSVQALEKAVAEDKRILLVAQKNSTQDDPAIDDIYKVGTVSGILQLLKLPDGTIKLLVEGIQRARITQFLALGQILFAQVTPLSSGSFEEKEIEVLLRSISTRFEQYTKLNKKTPPDLLTSLANIHDPSRWTDTVAAHLPIKLEEKQKILEQIDVTKRLELLLGLIDAEVDLFQVEKRIRKRVKGQMEKNQREYYLNEQMKAIQKELGELEDVPNETEDLKQKIERVGMPKVAKVKALAEWKKLKMMSPMSSEATVIRNYLDVLTNVPWKKRTKICRDIKKAGETLEADHYGLEKVKERILEHLAVQLRVNSKVKGPILCLVGPPGVGKTSLGQSMARATNRKFVRMSLGGVRDEAEIRGHRRTYIGALPGKIIHNLIKVGVRNPLFLLDEVDKMTMDFRGDPSAALLEVLDPEQNHTFNDHYMELDFDLSEVMFVATANSLNIPPPLLDRMEIIRISGYTEDEKLNIAERYLLPKQLKQSGLKAEETTIDKLAILDVIRYYTREAGVRNLERELAKICRKVVKEILLVPEPQQREVTTHKLQHYLGVQKFRYGRAEEQDRVGQVTGLAWTEVGGDLLTIEAAVMPGKGKLLYTGHLGDVMQESIQAAMSVVRGRTRVLGIEKEFYQKYDLHIHVPEGATPKDGPSAGVGMCTAMVSALTKIPVCANVAMTGEITLRGEILPIGGLKEKLLAALRGGVRVVLIPEENRKDLQEIPENIKSNLEIRPVRWMDEVLNVALQRYPKPKEDDSVIVTTVPNPVETIVVEPLQQIQTH